MPVPLASGNPPTMPPKMVFCEMGPLVVSVCAAQAPTDNDWDAYLQFCREKLAKRTCAGVLVVTAGGGPNTKQRKATREVFGDGSVRVAVVSDAPMVRGIITAFGWFNPAMRSFAFNNGAGIHDALKYLQIDGFVAARLLLEVKSMQRQIGAT